MPQPQRRFGGWRLIWVLPSMFLCAEELVVTSKREARCQEVLGILLEFCLSFPNPWGFARLFGSRRSGTPTEGFFGVAEVQFSLKAKNRWRKMGDMPMGQWEESWSSKAWHEGWWRHRHLTRCHKPEPWLCPEATCLWLQRCYGFVRRQQGLFQGTAGIYWFVSMILLVMGTLWCILFTVVSQSKSHLGDVHETPKGPLLPSDITGQSALLKIDPFGKAWAKAFGFKPSCDRFEASYKDQTHILLIINKLRPPQRTT